MAELALSFASPNYYAKFPKGLITFVFIPFEGDIISKRFGTESFTDSVNAHQQV